MEEKVVKSQTGQITPQAAQTIASAPAVESDSKVKQVADLSETRAEPQGVDPLTEPHLTNPFFYEVANYFGVEQKNYDVAKEKLAAIVDWAFTEVGTKNTGDLLLKIREMEDSIQPAEWGEKRYSNVYKYVRLASQRQSVDKAMRALQKDQKEKKKNE